MKIYGKRKIRKKPRKAGKCGYFLLKPGDRPPITPPLIITFTQFMYLSLIDFSALVFQLQWSVAQHMISWTQV